MKVVFILTLTAVLTANQQTRAAPLAYSQAENEFVRVLASEAIAKAVEASPSHNACTLPVVEPLQFENLTKRRSILTVLDREQNKQRLSVLSPKEANDIQTYLSAQDRLAFGFTESGCVQRALEVNRILRTQGIEAGMIQAFNDSEAEGEGFRVDSPPAPAGTVWKFHTAAVIAVIEKGKSVIRVIDPGLSSKLLTKSEWLKELQRRSTNDSKVESDFMSLKSEYTDANLERANLTLKIFREAEHRRAEFLKNREMR